VQIDTNIDDMNPQFLPPLLQKLLDAGAVDAWLTPVQMKKGRPGVVVSALAPAAAEEQIADALLRHSTTLGLRVHAVHRHEAPREQRTVDTAYGPVRVKLKRLAGGATIAHAEYEDCQRLADRHGLAVQTVFDAAMAAWEQARPRSAT
jgi:uncharacterized protein (DUF111 family)